MRIAVNAADLDHSRVDGTRIYIQNILNKIGSLNKEDQFLIYHKSEFNPQLTFPIYENYDIRKLSFPFWWTQTRFAFEIFRERPDVLWMPMHSLPYLRSKKTKTIVTIHDLAFKYFPQFFPKKDLRRLNYFTDYAVRCADKLIAVSNSTKKDLLKVYPGLCEEKIKVIYHGYDKKLFDEDISREQIEKVLVKYKIPARIASQASACSRSDAGGQNTRYIIYVGAIQPRKNISTLIDAFEILRKEEKYKDLRLVIAGEQGWLFDDVMRKIRSNKSITATGRFFPRDLPALLRGAEVFVLPSLYEGFGLPAIEAMACGVPVVAADNSSLSELVGESGILYKPNNAVELAKALREVLEDSKLQNQLKEKGLERVKYFSWEKCARETLEWLKS